MTHDTIGKEMTEVEVANRLSYIQKQLELLRAEMLCRGYEADQLGVVGIDEVIVAVKTEADYWIANAFD
jgi:hypothetical protein